MKYDIESFINDIVTLLKNNLTTKINAVNTEKSDTITLATIGDDYYYDDISEQVLNRNEFIYYNIVDITTNTLGGQTNLTVVLQVSVIFDNRNQTDTLNRVLRYSRCLREVIQDKYSAFNASASDLKVTEYVPVDIQSNEGGLLKMGGIQITTDIVG